MSAGNFAERWTEAETRVAQLQNDVNYLRGKRDELQAEVERLKSELSQAAGLAMALMAHVPDNLLVGDVRPRALTFCREWGELQGYVDGVRKTRLDEREACAAICDARSRMHNASGIVHTHSDQVRYLEARRIAELIRERS